MCQRPNVFLVVLALVVLPAVRAQTALRTIFSHPLGQRVAGVEAGAIKVRGSPDTAASAATSVNLPVSAHLDVSAGYSFSQLNTVAAAGGIFEVSDRTHAVFATTTAYLGVAGVKPFLTAGMGYELKKTNVTYNGVKALTDDDGESTWALALGVEIPWSRVTLTPRISYQDYFHRDFFHDRIGGFSYGAEALVWITKSTGVLVDATYFNSNEGRFSPWNFQSWSYMLGARWRF